MTYSCVILIATISPDSQQSLRSPVPDFMPYYLWFYGKRIYAESVFGTLSERADRLAPL